MYPVRGIHGIIVNQCEMTPYGLKYDRRWIIVGKKRMRPLSCSNSHIFTYLRCCIETVDGEDYAKLGGEPKKLRIFLQDDKCFPEVKKRNHELLFDRDYLGAEIIKATSRHKFRGPKESDEVCNWLSELFGEEVFLIRAMPEHVMTPAPHLDRALGGDRIGGFLCAAAIHVCNE